MGHPPLGCVTALCTAALVTTPPTPQQLTTFRPLPWNVLVTVSGILVLVRTIPVWVLRVPVPPLRLKVMVTVWCLLVPVRVTPPLVRVRLTRSRVLTPPFMLTLVTLTERTLNVALVLSFPLSIMWETELGPLSMTPREVVELTDEMTFLFICVNMALLLVLLISRPTPVCIAMWVPVTSRTLLPVMVVMGGAPTIPGPIDTRMVLNMLWFVRLTVAVTPKLSTTPVPRVDISVRMMSAMPLFVRQRVLSLPGLRSRLVPASLTTEEMTAEGGIPC